MKTVICLVTAVGLCFAQDAAQSAIAEKARDSGDVAKLQELVAGAQKAAVEKNTAAAQQWIAMLDFYLLEAIYVQGKTELTRATAEEGFAAAERSAELDPISSETHRLLADLAVMLIPYSPNGGAIYGKRTAVEAAKAIELDPKNAKAWVSRGLSAFYTPAAAGGDKDKGIELMKKAVALDATFDVPHIFLAQMYLATNRKEDAVREIKEALRLNPERRTAQMTYKTVMAATTKP